MTTFETLANSVSYARGSIRKIYRDVFADRSRGRSQDHSKVLLLMSIGDETQGRDELRRTYEMGIVATHRGHSIREMFEAMDAFGTSLDGLVAEGYAKEENSRVCLTQKGAAAASAATGKFARVIESMSSGLHASAVSIVVNVVIAAVSLAAGLLSNSMGLISSGVDNTASIATSAAAYVGIKHRKESVANAIIVAMIVVLSLVLGYESFQRLLYPEPVDSGIIPIAVAIFTGVACYLLSLYQRFHGRRSGKFSLIILAVDNLNSVLISAAVLIGVLFASFGFTFVDSLVSLGITIIMLKSAIDLGLETLRIAEGKEPDLSQYELGIEKRMTEIRKYRTQFWIMYLLQEPRTNEELDEIFSGKHAGGLRFVTERLQTGQDISHHYADCLHELADKDLAICSSERYCLTTDGMRVLSEVMAGKAGFMAERSAFREGS
jgi:Predicted Co/Zn/Cd cation transporters